MKEQNYFEGAIKLLFPAAIVAAVTYFCYPFELDAADHAAYLRSYGTTLALTSLALIIGAVGGLFLAFLLTLKNRVLTLIINEYLDLIRGMPVMLLLMIFAFVIFVRIDETFYVAVLALGLNSTAYVAEIIRSGIESIDRGQMEAARAMGLSYAQAMRHVIFPQAIKNIIPALANEFISLFKETSVVAFISVVDFTYQSKIFQAALYDPKPYIFAGVVYYASVKIFTFFVRILETRLKKHD